MAIGPIGAINYANQAMPAQTKIQANFQNRLDMQSSVAAAIQEDDKKEIEDIRPSEESYKIDPENEHEKEKQDEQSGEKEKEAEFLDKIEKSAKNKKSTTHLLDIKV